MSNIVQLEEDVDKCVQLLVAKFTDCAMNGSVVDMSEWVQW
jgi:hypothetical protein